MHLRCLENLIERFRDTKPYVLGVERGPDPDPPSVGINYSFVVCSSDPVPAAIGLTAGDFLTNLRGALDHLAWELVLAHPPNPPDEHTAFPIREKPPRASGSGISVPLNVSGGVSTKALALIESAQPYNRPDGGQPQEDRLWILDRLVSIDKHRHLLLTTAGYDRVSFGIYGERHSMPVMDQPLPLEAGAQVSAFFTPDPSEQVDMDIDLATTVALRKGEPGGGEALDALLLRLLVRVRDEVVPSFDGLW